jgi:hypothetical protein
MYLYRIRSLAGLKADISKLTAAPMRFVRSMGAKIRRQRIRNEKHMEHSKINLFEEDSMDTFQE